VALKAQAARSTLNERRASKRQSAGAGQALLTALPKSAGLRMTPAAKATHRLASNRPAGIRSVDTSAPRRPRQQLQHVAQHRRAWHALQLQRLAA
jgi:hypothetical protein